MNLFDVYPLFDIEIEKGQGAWVYDNEGNRYLDLYGGHAVISIGHGHPHYVGKIIEQLKRIGFYSNSIQIPFQKELAQKLGELSGKNDYNLFLCNSGAEANENAIKLASFVTGKKKIISFSKGFHGRTSLAVAATDNPNIVAPVNETKNTIILPFNDEEALQKAFKKHEGEIAAVIIEGIQGIGGINLPDESFIKLIRELCDQQNSLYIADAVQCGYGRSGKFFSHDYYGIDADIYTMAKGMGNGFPIGGIIIKPSIEAKHGMLGTTFGGNHLACAAAIAVLDVMKAEKVMENALELEDLIKSEVSDLPGVKEVRGRGLMIGVEMDYAVADLRKKLLFEEKIFTGSSSNKNTIRLLPALNVKKEEVDLFIGTLKKIL